MSALWILANSFQFSQIDFTAITEKIYTSLLKCNIENIKISYLPLIFIRNLNHTVQISFRI